MPSSSRPRGEAANTDQIRLSVPELLVGDASATSLALIVHELATNSLKYGALSNAAGTLEVAGVEKEGEVILTWTE